MIEMVFLSIAVATVLGVFTLICLNLYQIFEEPNIEKRMRKLRKPVQPWATVLLYGTSTEDINASRKALLKSRYYNYDTVIVKSCSEKDLRAGYRRSRRGEIIVSIEAGTIVAASFLKRAVAFRGGRERFAMRIYTPKPLSSLSEIICSIKNLAWWRSRKVWVSDVKNIATVPKSTNFLYIDLLTILLFICVVVASILIHDAIIFWYGWLIVTSYLCAVIWLDNEEVSVKAKLTFSALSAFFVIPIFNLINIMHSQFRSRN